jgi:hypothetical protein
MSHECSFVAIIRNINGVSPATVPCTIETTGQIFLFNVQGLALHLQFSRIGLQLGSTKILASLGIRLFGSYAAYRSFKL